MTEIERNMMLGMINILNEVSQLNNNETPIMNKEQFDSRLSDLKLFEEETNTVYISSPSCKTDTHYYLKSIPLMITNSVFFGDYSKVCRNISDVVEYSNKEEMLAYVDIDGEEMQITYANGYVTNIQFNGDQEKLYDMIRYNKVNFPYKIAKNKKYTVKGKLSNADKPIFYVTNVVKGDCENYKDSLDEALELGFDIIPYWGVANPNLKVIENLINYISDYAQEDGLNWNGIVFKFNNVKQNEVFNIMSNNALAGIVYYK